MAIEGLIKGYDLYEHLKIKNPQADEIFLQLITSIEKASSALMSGNDPLKSKLPQGETPIAIDVTKVYNNTGTLCIEIECEKIRQVGFERLYSDLLFAVFENYVPRNSANLLKTSSPEKFVLTINMSEWKKNISSQTPPLVFKVGNQELKIPIYKQVMYKGKQVNIIGECHSFPKFTAIKKFLAKNEDKQNYLLLLEGIIRNKDFERVLFKSLFGEGDFKNVYGIEDYKVKIVADLIMVYSAIMSNLNTQNNNSFKENFCVNIIPICKNNMNAIFKDNPPEIIKEIFTLAMQGNSISQIVANLSYNPKYSDQDWLDAIYVTLNALSVLFQKNDPELTISINLFLKNKSDGYEIVNSARTKSFVKNIKSILNNDKVSQKCYIFAGFDHMNDIAQNLYE